MLLEQRWIKPSLRTSESSWQERRGTGGYLLDEMYVPKATPPGLVGCGCLRTAPPPLREGSSGAYKDSVGRR